MRSYVSRSLFLVLLMASVSACPRIPAVSTGEWLFIIDEGTADEVVIGILLRNDGQTQPLDPLPPEADANFSGTVSWVQNGSAFTLTQVTNTNTYQYAGTVDTSTSIINGTRRITGGGAIGTWTGMKL